MFAKKTPSQILNNGLTLLKENTPIDNLNPGSVARTIIESYAHELGTGVEQNNLYDVAEYILNNGFLSLAADEYLDLIGALLNCPRRMAMVYDKELGMEIEQPIDAETYRFEISRRVHTIASSNEEALRLALMAINGIADVVGEEYTHGTGSFTFLIIPAAGYSNESILYEAEYVVGQVKAYGVKYEIKTPKEVLLDMRLQLVVKESTTTTQRASALSNARSHLQNHFIQFDVGQPFIYNDFVQEVMNSDGNIMDFKVLSFYMDNEPILLTNQSVAADEQIRPGFIETV